MQYTPLRLGLGNVRTIKVGQAAAGAWWCCADRAQSRLCYYENRGAQREACMLEVTRHRASSNSASGGLFLVSS
eukprot:1778583-Pleurochrysis_carterae.AAC.2